MASKSPNLRPVVVTNCTTRKRAPHPPVSLPAGSVREPLLELARRWDRLLRKAPKVTAVGDLYVGRAIVESKSVTRSLGADLYIVSAGLGLVREMDLVPNYDLTVGTSNGPLNSALKSSGKDSTHWWALRTKRVEAAGSLANLVCSMPNRKILIALPATYLQMVADDLGMIDADAAKRLRIFTSEAGRAKVPNHLLHCVLPYDERLESLDDYQGTRAEFPQRALRHFVEVLEGHQLALCDAHMAVSAALARLKKRKAPTRQKATDDQIASMLRAQWFVHAGSSTRLLRYLRDKALVACEQSRFQTIWRAVHAEHYGKEASANAA
jgi:hypothetical protein